MGHIGLSSGCLPGVFGVPGGPAVLTFASVIIAGSAFAQSFSLVEDGKPRAEIVVSSGGIDTISPWLAGAELRLEKGKGKPTFYPWTRAGVRAAVADFNEALARCVGCKLPVVAERTAGSRAILFEVKPAGLVEDDGFSIDFPEVDTMLIKGSGRSVMRIPIARPEDVDVDDRVEEGAKPTQDAPWHFNVCRLRVREDEKSTSAFSATGGGFHVVSRFAKLVAR